MLQTVLPGLVTRRQHFALEKKNCLLRERQITVDIHTLPRAGLPLHPHDTAPTRTLPKLTCAKSSGFHNCSWDGGRGHHGGINITQSVLTRPCHRLDSHGCARMMTCEQKESNELVASRNLPHQPITPSIHTITLRWCSCPGTVMTKLLNTLSCPPLPLEVSQSITSFNNFLNICGSNLSTRCEMGMAPDLIARFVRS
jgi:hypothetical protein